MVTLNAPAILWQGHKNLGTGEEILPAFVTLANSALRAK
jgi:hypothetical protein